MLRGLRVVDFSWSLPGPYASLYLADLGAHVVRVEARPHPELFRSWPPCDEHGRSFAHHYVNRGKQTVSLDLRDEADLEVARGLVMQSDVLIEQFRPGVMARFGLGFDACRALNRRLVYCSITGYGQTGPYRDRAGHDLNYLALSGAASALRAAGQPPSLSALPLADLAGGSLHAVFGVLAALWHRDGPSGTGEGQFVDVSMTDAMFALNALAAPAALNHDASGQTRPGPLDGGSHYGYYRTSDDRYMAVAGLEPKFRLALCQALERADLAPLALDDAAEAQDRFRTELERIFRTRTQRQWVERFANVDACAEPVLDPREAAEHPQLLARGCAVTITSDGLALRQPAHPVRYSAG